MPEYLAPGVFMEEVSFRSKSIEGVPTSTTGFVGYARYGPVRYEDGPTPTEPRLVTSFTEYEQVYGGLERLEFSGAAPTAPYMAHAARMFFLNGGRRLYVSRVFVPDPAVGSGVAESAPISVDPALPSAQWRARWPGKDGDVSLSITPMRSKLSVYTHPVHGLQVRGAIHGSVIEILPPPPPPPAVPPASPPNDIVPVIANLHVVLVQPSGAQQFFPAVPGGLDPAATINLLEMKVEVRSPSGRADFYPNLAGHRDQRRYIGRILDLDDPEDENALVAFGFDWPSSGAPDATAALLTFALLNTTPVALDPTDNVRKPRFLRLSGGHDGLLPTALDMLGEEANPDVATEKATGLHALAEVEEIAIVAMPDSASLGSAQHLVAVQYLIAHAEMAKYRIAVVDGPESSSLNEIRAFRGQFDSKYAALYHPWVEVLDPLERPAQGAPPRRMNLPPSGFVAGIYARNDIERGVHKAPANEIVRGLTRFEININRPRQEVLNPEGINALRFLEGRGNRVWGARTMSSDPEWKYVNVRRLFIFLEHSIDKSMQWAVFEPNNRMLWDNIRTAVEDFLLVQWMQGALLGDKPEEAYFVRCDRTTMTQNDLDNGRLVCLIGVAPTKPAEFVIFRIGQWTADAKRS
jgi:phage tail sheath protein FI